MSQHAPASNPSLTALPAGRIANPLSWGPWMFACLTAILLALGCGGIRAQDKAIRNETLNPPQGFSGDWVAWWPNGQKRCETRYVAGQRDGKSIHWHPNGVKGTEMEYVKGEVHGTLTNWDEAGKKSRQANYDNGELLEMTYWNPDGSLRDGVETTYHEDGKKKSEEHYVQGKHHGGANTYWNKDGSKQREEEYKNGLPDGFFRVWNDKGVLISETQFLAGKPHGREVRWHPNGWKELEREFDHGKLVRQVPVPGDDSPKEWGAEQAKADLAKGVRKVYGFGMATITQGPPKDRRSGLPVEMVAGCVLSHVFSQKLEGYNEVMRAAANTAP